MINSLRPKIERMIAVAACLPCCIFYSCFSISVATEKSIAFSRGDLVICGLVVLLSLAICWTRKNVKLAARLAVLQWTLLLALLPVEFALRSLFKQPPAPWYPNTVREITLNVPLDGVSPSGTFSTNEIGLRGRPFGLSDLRTSKLSVLCVGGSTTECFYNSDQNAWPAVMETMIAPKFGGKVFVGNAGRGGHIAQHHARQMQYYRYAREFDVVVVLCGWNDLAAALFGNAEDAPRNIAAEALTGGVDFSASAEPHTPFYRNLAIARLLQQVVLQRPWNSTAMIGWRAVSQDPYGEWIAKRRLVRKTCLEAGAMTDEPVGFDAAIEAYKEDLRAITESLAPGQSLVFVTQPTLCRAGLSPEQSGWLWSCDGRRAWTAESTAAMLDRMNEAMRAICRQQGIACVDAASLLSGNAQYFYDDCHFSDAGCRAMAQVVMEGVIALAVDKGHLNDKLTP